MEVYSRDKTIYGINIKVETGEGTVVIGRQMSLRCEVTD